MSELSSSIVRRDPEAEDVGIGDRPDDSPEDTYESRVMGSEAREAVNDSRVLV
jgi:hypothetical protein